MSVTLLNLGKDKPFKCDNCARESSNCVGIAARRYFPNAIDGPILLETNDLDLESFCSISCLCSKYADISADNL